MGDNLEKLSEPQQEAVWAKAYLNKRINPRAVALGEMGALSREVNRIAADEALVADAVATTKEFVGKPASLVEAVLSQRALDEYRALHGKHLR